MPKVKEVTPHQGIKRYRINCPGCNEVHDFNATWQFNGDFDKPTISPSLLVRSGHFLNPNDDTCWCVYNKEKIDKGEKPAPFTCAQCHSFIKDGMIQFLGDCSHDLKNQTVELPEIS